MLKRCVWGSLALLLAVTAILLGSAGAQDANSNGRLVQSGLKKAIEDVGYEVKALNSEPGKEKWEFKLERGGLNIPISAEISPSGNYIWFTVFLGKAPEKFGEAGEKLGGLLKANASIQPVQFYITTKGNLMMGVAIDNRAVTNPVVRRNIEMLVDNVVNQKSTWQ